MSADFILLGHASFAFCQNRTYGVISLAWPDTVQRPRYYLFGPLSGHSATAVWPAVRTQCNNPGIICLARCPDTVQQPRYYLFGPLSGHSAQCNNPGIICLARCPDTVQQPRYYLFGPLSGHSATTQVLSVWPAVRTQCNGPGISDGGIAPFLAPQSSQTMKTWVPHMNNTNRQILTGYTYKRLTAFKNVHVL